MPKPSHDPPAEPPSLGASGAGASEDGADGAGGAHAGAEEGSGTGGPPPERVAVGPEDVIQPGERVEPRAIGIWRVVGLVVGLSAALLLALIAFVAMGLIRLA